MKRIKTEQNFSRRSVRAVLVGYALTGKVLRHPSSEKVNTSGHVVFNEKVVKKDVYQKNSDHNPVEL